MLASDRERLHFGACTLQQARPLETTYPLIFFDALRVKIRDEGLVRNKAVHIALGVRADGAKEILGLWLEQNEGAKFWLRVMNELKNRGVEDVLIAVVDGLKGFPRRSLPSSRRRRCRPASFICCATASISSPGKTVSPSPPRSRASTGPSMPMPAKSRSAPSRRVSGISAYETERVG